jgi:hypothetical protein
VKTKFFETRTEFYPAWMKAQWDVNIVMGHNAGSGPIMQRPTGFQCVWVWISTGPSGIYVYILPYVYWIPTCVKFRSFTTT